METNYLSMEFRAAYKLLLKDRWIWYIVQVQVLLLNLYQQNFISLHVQSEYKWVLSKKFETEQNTNRV